MTSPAFASSFLAPLPAPTAATAARTSPRTITMRQGTVAGNNSLPKLGLAKFEGERFRVYSPARPAGFSAEYEEIICGAYRQVFGNAYVMESERAEMAKAESELRDGQLTVKEFCRALAKSYQYRKRFFDGRPLYGAIELNFKHLLGRTPDGLEQYRAKSAVYDTQGYEKFVDAFFDDGEYDDVFDDYTVPYYRGHKTEANLSMAAFTHMFQVVRGASTSDKSNGRTLTNQIPLNRAGIASVPKAVIPPGTAGSTFLDSSVLPGSWNNGASGGAAPSVRHGQLTGDRMFRIEVSGYSQGGTKMGAAGISVTRAGKFYPARNNSAAKLSTFRQANKSFLCTFDELSSTYQKIHNMGGKIASITPA
eukprot:CAMPEP_0198318484 /NCGR_PEP_ID=MMETSP1450-20131203/7800_1 /TAXON_ID=753684 ORGANISM="Madagascaria erythrocladiodes, Strain CCMP3234" /NCGR_SAMPLE_ID=MMETSP1450 /ASSEMBLY_ACC=CAM_ASM_001115 /LENGTH=363 /DNA_ID=CAMNT_0044021785 /DNA_START=80 /DNA_END=1171 /DNA_ORIENTATION=-